MTLKDYIEAKNLIPNRIARDSGVQVVTVHYALEHGGTRSSKLKKW